MSARWNSADLAPKKPRASPATPTKGKTPPTEREPATSEETTLPIPAPTQYYVGPYQLAVANGTHFPDRMRAALVGPSDAKLIKVLVEAMKLYVAGRM